MSLCDTCPAPGHCCRTMGLGLASAANASTIETAQAWMADMRDPDGGKLPFRPLFKRQDGLWVWWCPNLNARTGRCDDYANRPLACRDYEPASDGLCILHEPTHGPRR